MKNRQLHVLLFFLYSLMDVSSTIPIPKPLKSLLINSTLVKGGCPFTLSIRTSCSSPKYTRDLISIAFGDAYGNQVYVPGLDDPRSKTFERCSTDIFHVEGPCTYQICYVYVYRSGWDGWRPKDVTISGYNTRTVTFRYDSFVPRDVWYGFNTCFSNTPHSWLASLLSHFNRVFYF